MKLLRNKEIKNQMIVLVVLSVIYSSLIFFINHLSGIISLCFSILFNIVSFLFLKKRYSNIERLSDTIDKILHGEDTIKISDSDEGELSILKTEIEKMTIRLKEQNDLLQKDKLKMGNGIADISHQLRTPLTSINLAISLLSQNDIKTEKRLKLIHELKNSIARIEWLTESLLKLSKLDANTVKFKKNRICVDKLIKTAIDPLIIPMELKQQVLKISILDESFIGDFNWFVEAIRNIIKNCIEHTQNKGEIEISANETSIFTEITISDNGIGFDKNDLPHIFERFYKGKDSNSSSVGIGLSLSRAIISAQNGTITATNNAHGGAKFQIKIYKSII